jgi:hypothetical protein
MFLVHASFVSLVSRAADGSGKMDGLGSFSS